MQHIIWQVKVAYSWRELLSYSRNSISNQNRCSQCKLNLRILITYYHINKKKKSMPFIWKRYNYAQTAGCPVSTSLQILAPHMISSQYLATNLLNIQKHWFPYWFRFILQDLCFTHRDRHPTVRDFWYYQKGVLKNILEMHPNIIRMSQNV